MFLIATVPIVVFVLRTVCAKHNWVHIQRVSCNSVTSNTFSVYAQNRMLLSTQGECMLVCHRRRKGGPPQYFFGRGRAPPIFRPDPHESKVLILSLHS